MHLFKQGHSRHRRTRPRTVRRAHPSAGTPFAGHSAARSARRPPAQRTAMAAQRGGKPHPLHRRDLPAAAAAPPLPAGPGNGPTVTPRQPPRPPAAPSGAEAPTGGPTRPGPAQPRGARRARRPAAEPSRPPPPARPTLSRAEQSGPGRARRPGSPAGGRRPRRSPGRWSL